MKFGKYDGEFKNNKMCGKGSLKYDNGNMYVGNWKNSKF